MRQWIRNVSFLLLVGTSFGSLGILGADLYRLFSFLSFFVFISTFFPPQWSVDRVEGVRPYTLQRLRAFGIAPGELDTAAARVTDTLCAVLGSERGRWILAEGHGEARNEFPLTTLSDGRFANVLIDRTFVDNGVCWIIDYKTGVHAGGSEEAFIASEVERYTPQLERYARIMRGVEQRPIRLGLYFPLLGGWHEWAFDDG